MVHTLLANGPHLAGIVYLGETNRQVENGNGWFSYILKAFAFFQNIVTYDFVSYQLQNQCQFFLYKRVGIVQMNHFSGVSFCIGINPNFIKHGSRLSSLLDFMTVK